jgi:hypothetical protein
LVFFQHDGYGVVDGSEEVDGAGRFGESPGVASFETGVISVTGRGVGGFLSIVDGMLLLVTVLSKCDG